MNTFKILIVDDDRIARTYIYNSLKDRYTVYSANNGEEALNFFLNNKVDLVITDLEMPVIDGFELCDILKRISRPNFIPVIVLTATHDFNTKIKTLEGGADDYIYKPFEIRELIAKIEIFRKIKTLEDNLCTTNEELKKLTNELMGKNEKINYEMQLASRLQYELLPKLPINNSIINYSWKYIPSIYVAGDMLNVFQLDDNSMGFYVLDVMGHGVSASLKAILLGYLLRPSIYSSDSKFKTSGTNPLLPSSTLKYLSKHFFETFGKEDRSFFFTIFFGVINLNTLDLIYTRAGHCPPIIVDKNKNVQELKKGNPPIGLFDNIEYNDYKIQLKSGDRIFLYTDGITEARNESKNEFFSKKRFIDLLVNYNDSDVNDLTNHVVSDVLRFTESEHTNDDITLLGIEVK